MASALLGFFVFAVTMGMFVFSLGLLGGRSGAQIARSLRRWGHWIQVGSASLIVLVGLVLIYASTNPGVFDRLILP